MAFRRTPELAQPVVTPRPPRNDREMQEYENEPITSFWVLLARIVWFFAGPVTLLMLAFRIASTKDGWAAPTDIAFPLVLFAVIGARWYCFSANDRTDTQGKVTTIENLQRYTRTVTICSILLWVGANVVGNVFAG